MAKGAVRMNITLAPEVAATLQWMSDELRLPMSSILSSALLYTIENAKDPNGEAEARFFARADEFLRLQYGPPSPVFGQIALWDEPKSED